MRTSSLGWAISHVRPHLPAVVTLPPTDPVIEYNDTRAEVLPSRLLLMGSVTLTFTIVCFNIVYLATY